MTNHHQYWLLIIRKIILTISEHTILKVITVLLIICTFTDTGDAIASAMSRHNGNKGLVGILTENIF